MRKPNIKINKRFIVIFVMLLLALGIGGIVYKKVDDNNYKT